MTVHRTNWAPQDGNDLAAGINGLAVAANETDGGTGKRLLTLNAGGTGTLHLLRVGRFVTIRHLGLAGALTVLYTLPLGFRPAQNLSIGAWNTTGVWTPLSILSNGQIIKTTGAAYSTSAWQEYSFVTENAWPATLPGVEA